jgi:hypothetical protein
VDLAAAEVSESSSLRPATPIDEAAPAASPSLPTLQEHDVLGSTAGVTSLEIQEVREGSGAAQLLELEEGDVRISDLARFSWAAAFEADAAIDEDEECAARHSLKCGLLWACRAFDKLILLAKR